MTAHTHAAAAVLAENSRQLARLRLESERLRRDVELLERREGKRF